MSTGKFLKWAGSKQQLLPELYKSMSAFKAQGHYYEPFVGSGALFFDMRATGWTGAATLSDANERLVRTYAGVRDDVHRVIAGLRERAYTRECFASERAFAVDAAEDWRVAVWFIYLNRTCFNGLYRVNKRGGFNVPFGRYTNPTICDAEGLHVASRALERTKILSEDFEAAVRGAKSGDLVYFDPPYVPVSATADFTSYTSGGFSDADHVRLRNCALELKKRGAHVILSNADCDAVRQMYKPAYGFDLRRVDARRSINSKGSARGAVGELIIT